MCQPAELSTQIPSAVQIAGCLKVGFLPALWIIFPSQHATRFCVEGGVAKTKEYRSYP